MFKLGIPLQWGQPARYLWAGAAVHLHLGLTNLIRGTLKKCVNSQAVYPLSEQDGLEAQERRYTAHEEGKH